MTSKILLSGGCVLTLGAKTPNFTRADVLIDGETVAEIGTGLRARDAEQVDATDTIVMPGFVDTHRHAWRSLSRNVGAWPPDGGRPERGDAFRPEDVYAATLIGLLGAIEAGITTVVDWSPIRSDDALVDAALRAHADAGLRTVFVHRLAAGTEDRRSTAPAIRQLVARLDRGRRTAHDDRVRIRGPRRERTSNASRPSGRQPVSSGCGSTRTPTRRPPGQGPSRSSPGAASWGRT